MQDIQNMNSAEPGNMPLNSDKDAIGKKRKKKRKKPIIVSRAEEKKMSEEERLALLEQRKQIVDKEADSEDNATTWESLVEIRTQLISMCKDFSTQLFALVDVAKASRDAIKMADTQCADKVKAADDVVITIEKLVEGALRTVRDVYIGRIAELEVRHGEISIVDDKKIITFKTGKLNMLFDSETGCVGSEYAEYSEIQEGYLKLLESLTGFMIQTFPAISLHLDDEAVKTDIDNVVALLKEQYNYLSVMVEATANLSNFKL